MKEVDTVIMGRKTYDWIMNILPEFLQADKNTFVITRQERQSIGNTVFYTGELKSLIASISNSADPNGSGLNIFAEGGGEIIHEMLNENLIGEIIISIIPILVGAGTRLFAEGIPELQLELISCQHFEKGLVQLHCRRVDNAK